MKTGRIKTDARKVILAEASAVRRQARHIDAGFVSAVRLAATRAASGGKLIVAGVGKSGFIARKISATLSSVGIPSVFVNITELVHGDLGMITAGDTLLALSYSGDSDELKKILPHVRSVGTRIIAMSGRPSSYLARLADCLVRVSVAEEACPFNLVPTSSTAAMLAMGDAFAVSAALMRGFKKDDFARYHPGGNLGRKLNLKVSSLMRRGRGNPVIKISADVSAALAAMSDSKLGAVSIVDSRGRMAGYFTDGDLRRQLQKKGARLLEMPVSRVMTRSPRTVTPSAPASEAAVLMKKYNCDNLPVVDARRRPIGVIDERDLVATGLL